MQLLLFWLHNLIKCEWNRPIVVDIAVGVFAKKYFYFSYRKKLKVILLFAKKPKHSQSRSKKGF